MLQETVVETRIMNLFFRNGKIESILVIHTSQYNDFAGNSFDVVIIIFFL